MPGGKGYPAVKGNSGTERRGMIPEKIEKTKGYDP